MKKFWDMTVNFMDQCWNQTVGFLAKVNSWIPLSMVMLAGMCLLAVVLILAICGCVKRKRLVPNWLIWTYFTFAVIVIIAHVGNDLSAIIEAVEIPVLVVLLSYILLFLFRRRARYTYVEKQVYLRELAKGRVCQVEDENQNDDNQDDAIEMKPAKQNKKEKQQAVEEVVAEENENVTEEVVEEIDMRAKEKAEREAEAAKLAAAEKAAREAREAEKEAERKAAEKAARETFSMPVKEKEEPVKRVDKNDFLTARAARPTMTSSTATATVDLPTVNPIPDKTYEPMREPTIVTKPISQTIPGLKMTGTTTTSRFSTTTRPTTTTTTSRPTSFTTTRPTTTSSFSSMSSRPSATTTSTFNRTTSSSTTTKTPTGNTATNTRSTEDIMAAIERLRNSMKK